MEQAEGTRLRRSRKPQQLLEHEKKITFRKLVFCWFVWQHCESDEGKQTDKTLSSPKGYQTSTKAQCTCSATAPQLVPQLLRHQF